jgi:capsular polysaccharide biosynthesis protein
MPTTRAFWQIMTDERGHAFAWINYVPVPVVGGRPATFRLEGPCEILGDNGWLLSREGWYACCSWYSGHTYVPGPLRPRTPAYRRTYRRIASLRGVTLSALTDHADAYGHLLMEGFYKLLKGLEMLGGAEQVDHIVVPPGMERILRRSVLANDSLLHAKLLPADQRAVYRTEALIAVTHPACCMNVSEAQTDLLRNARPRARTGSAQRIFLARPASERRGIANLDQVARVFERHGFLVTTGARLEDSWAAFAGADVVAGVQGSDLADCMFMRPGSTILEIVPSDHRKPYYYNVASNIGLDFRCLLARSATQRRSVHGFSTAEITIDVSALEMVLNAIERSAPGASDPRTPRLKGT